MAASTDLILDPVSVGQARGVKVLPKARKIAIKTCDVCGRKGAQHVRPYLESEPVGIRIACVGEAPGEDEDAAGKPFVGRSGKMLRATLKAAGYDDAEILFTNVMCCHPPGNATPTTEEINGARSRLIAELRAFKPDRILVLGATAATALLSVEGGGPQKINTIRGVWRKSPHLPGVDILCTLHPAALLRAPSGFATFAMDVHRVRTQITPFLEPEIVLVRNETEARRAQRQYLSLQPYEAVGIRTLDIETTGFNPRKRDILCLGISPDPRLSVIFTEEAMSDVGVWKVLQELANEEGLEWGGHNAIQFDEFFIKGWNGTSFTIKWDTMLMHYAVDERTNTHALDTLAQYYFGMPTWEGTVHKYLDSQWGYRDCPRDILYKYLALDTAVTHALFPILRAEISVGKLLSLYETVFVPAARMLAEIKCYGVRIDVPYLQKLGEEWDVDIQSMKSEMISIADDFGFIHYASGKKNPKPEKFNPNSTQQLQKLLYEVMKVPQVNLKQVASSSGDHKDTMTSTASDVINWLVGWEDGNGKHNGQIEDVPGREREYRFLKTLQSYRRLSKLQSTYIVGLLARVDEDGYIYPDFLIHGTETGRLSSRNPNIQNIPKHDYEDRKKKGLLSYADQIRYAFIPRPGYKFISTDYSQLEYRVCAWYCQDPGLIAAFNSGVDFHKAVASKIYNVPPEKVTKNQRHSAKFVNFGIMYGRQAKALSQSELMWAYSDKIPCTIEQAEQFLRNFLDLYPGQEQFMLDIERQVVEHGYVESHYGRRRRFPFIPDAGALMKFQREARNMPIQGTASDICLLAATRLHQRFEPDKARVLFLIHDDLTCEVREDVIEETQAMIVQEMENPPDLEYRGFKFAVEPEVLDRWALIDRED